MTGDCEVKRFAADTAATTTPTRAHSCRLKLVRLALSLAATLTALPSISEIPFLDSWLRSCARRRRREHCALSAMLTVPQLSKSFAGRALFDDVSLQVNRSDRIGLVGINGAGKSTCLRFCSVMYRPIMERSRSRRTQPPDFFRRKPPFKFEKTLSVFRRR